MKESINTTVDAVQNKRLMEEAHKRNQNQTLITAPHKQQQSIPRPKGSKNKVTTEVINKLQGVMDNVVSTLDIDSMTTYQKLKLFFFVFFTEFLP